MKKKIKSINWGDLRRTSPFCKRYGMDRGIPVDRFYIDRFLQANKNVIKGKCLELLNANYTKKYGEHVTAAEVLDIDPDNPSATIITDLQDADCIQANTFDCIILTQVLQFIPDCDAAIGELFRILKPGGFVLATVPSVSRIDCIAGTGGDYWRFTEAGIKFAFKKHFNECDLETESHGNVFTASAFLYGIAQEEITKAELRKKDEQFPLLITVKAKKPNKFKRPEQSPKKRFFKRKPKEITCIPLLYHRVADLKDDPQELSVSPAIFKEQLSYLSRKFEILSVSELITCIQKNSWPEQTAVTITFDDGYADNLHNAAEILTQYNMPAIFFVSSGYLNSTKEYWWDHLERIICHSNNIKQIVYENKKVSLSNSNKRMQFYKECCLALKPLQPKDRVKFINNLETLFGTSKPRKTHRSMTWEELKELANLPGMDIGGHTVDHLLLSAMPDKLCSSQIIEDKKILETNLGKRLRYFSYPFGVPSSDYNQHAMLAAKSAGYEAAFANNFSYVRADCNDLFQISRNIVRNWRMGELRGNLMKLINSEFSGYSETEVQQHVIKKMHSYLQKGSRPAVFGGGKHTVWLLSFLPEEIMMNIACIIDEKPSVESMSTIPVVTPGNIHRDVDCIILSTDTNETLFKQRCKSLFKDHYDLISLYRGFGKGPFPKTFK